jgi:3'-5' exoribonuclease
MVMEADSPDLTLSPDAAERGRRPDEPIVRVDSLRHGDQVNGLMACVRKAILTRSNGGDAFLAVILRDRTTAIAGRSFERVRWLAGRFEQGDVVHVRGRVTRYRDELQIRLEEVERREAPQDVSFAPVARRDLDELDGFLEHLARDVHESGCRRLLDSLLADAGLRRAWRRAPCTHDAHHAYLGGLLEHTVAVATLAAEVSELHPGLDRDLLMTAALTHDLGHTRAFTVAAQILPSEAGRLLGHIELGLEILRAHARRTSLPEARWQALAHCVLAHHGPEDAPASNEAVALYRLNALDARVQLALERRW